MKTAPTPGGGQEGAPIGGDLQDMNGETRARKEAQFQRQLLQTVLDCMPAAVNLIRGSDLRIQLVNPAYRAIAPGKDMVGRTLDELWPETGRTFLDICRRVLATGEPHHEVDEPFMISRSEGAETERAYFTWSLHRVRLPGDEGWAILNTAWETTDRKKAEEALRESEERFRAITETTSVGTGVVSVPEGRFLYVNEAYESRFGYDKGELLGRATPDIYWDPADREKILAKLREHGIVTDYEVRMKRKDGTPFWGIASIRPIFYGGKPALLGSFVDIDERKRVEAALRESEERFRVITETSLTPVGVGSLDGIVLYVNRSYEAAFGYGPGELVGKRAPDLYWDPADRDRLMAPVREGSPAMGIEARMRRKDGTPFWVLLSAAPVAFGGEKAVIGTVVDITKRKAAEQALVESEAKLRTILDATQESIWMFDQDGVVLLANAIAMARIGKSAQEILGKRMEDIIPPDLAHSRTERLREVVSTARPVEFEDTRAGMDFRHSFYPVTDTAGAVTAVVSFSRDITKYVKANAALRESEEKLRHLASFPQLNPNPVLELDLAGNVIYSNPFSNRIVREARLSGPADLLPADMPEVLAELRRHPGSTVSREISAGDMVFQVSIFQPAGLDLLRVYGVDITRRKRVEEHARRLAEAVQAEKDRLSALINSIADEIWFADPGGRFVLANPKALKEFGMAESGGRDINEMAASLEVLRPDGTARPAGEAPPLRALKGEVVVAQEEIVRTPGSGELRHRQVSAAPVRDPAGNIIGSVSVVRDITDRKRTEQALQKARERNAQQEKLAAIGRLAGGVAHELRNPLAAMKNAAYYLGMTADRSDPSVAETLAVLNREIARSDSVISSLLGLARPAQMSRTEVDVSTVVDSALGTLRLPPGVAVEKRLDEALPPVSADPAQLSIVFSNLLRNAVEAMPGGGRLSVSSSVDGNWVMVIIADSGAGMPPEVLQKLFEPLFTTKQGGTGLGLSVAKMLVEGSGGRIDVRSEPGSGSTFTVRLPVKRRVGQ